MTLLTEDILTTLIKCCPESQYRLSDKDFSSLFAECFGSQLRYNVTSHCWYAFNGSVWVADELSAANAARNFADCLLTYSGRLCSTQDGETFKPFIEYIAKFGSAKRRETIVNDSRAIMQCTMNDFDQKPHLLNFQNGTLDLNTFEFRSHSAADMLTRCCGCDYMPDSDLSEWEKFLLEIFEGNKDLIEYLQRLCGYFLTANTSLERAFMLFGSTTRNGKSTFCETISAALGSYATTITSETLCDCKRNSGAANPELAKLKGVRLVTVKEFSQSASLDVALFKSLTGGDTISTRFLHKDSFEFKPQFKLLLHTNHLPLVSDSTLFSSDRMRIIPFLRHFCESERDTTMKSRLTTPQNLAAVLAWAVEGLKRFRSKGEQPPNEVILQTQKYKHDSDKFELFLSECLIQDKNARCPISTAYPLYSEWCNKRRLPVDKKSVFIDSVKSHNLFLDFAKLDGEKKYNIITGYNLP